MNKGTPRIVGDCLQRFFAVELTPVLADASIGVHDFEHYQRPQLATNSPDATVIAVLGMLKVAPTAAG